MPDFSKLRAEFAQLRTEADSVIETATTEGRELSAEEKESNEKRFARLSAIKNLLDESVRFASLALAGDPEAKGTIEKPREFPGKQEFEASRHGDDFAAFDVTKAADRAAFSKAINEWAATGHMSDRRFATITTATASGALLPKEVAAPILTSLGNAFREGMARVGATPIQSDNAAELNLPIITISTGSDLSESATSGTDNTPTPASINLKPGVFQSGQAWVSNLELSAIGYDLLTAMLPGLIDAKEQRLEQKAIAAIIADSGITQVVDAGSTTTIDYDDLVDLDSAIGRRFDRQRFILLSDAAYVAAKKLKGDDGHPVLMLDPQNSKLLTFNGTPVIRSSFLEAFGTSKVIGLAVSAIGFKIRDCGTDKVIRILADKDKVDQTGFNVVGYNAYGYVPEAIAKLKTSAS